MAESEAKVEYSVKDRLAIQDKALERIEGKLDDFTLRQVEALADLGARVSILEQRPDLEVRVRSLETSRDQSAGERSYRRFLWPLFAAALGASSWLEAFIHHF